MLARLFWLLVMVLTSDPMRGQWNVPIHGTPALVAVAESADIPESSGLIASRVNPDVFWTHNDSGDYPPRIYAMRLNESDITRGIARHLGFIQLTNATMVDWEDIALGPGETIYVFDGGDNPPCNRSDKRIYRIVEPTIDPDGAPVALNAVAETIRFEYPDSENPSEPADSADERFDAESLMVHPTTGDIYVVTKRNTVNRAVARVYRLRASNLVWDDPGSHVLEFVTDITGEVPAMPTGADIDAWGRRVLIRTYLVAYEFSLDDGAAFEAIFSGTPRVFSLIGQLQGEAVCYDAQGRNILFSSEVIFFGPRTCPIYMAPSALFHQAGCLPVETLPVPGRKSSRMALSIFAKQRF